MSKHYTFLFAGLLCLQALAQAQTADDEQLFPGGFDFDAAMEDFDATMEDLLTDLSAERLTVDETLLTGSYSLDVTVGGNDASEAGCTGFYTGIAQIIVEYHAVPGIQEIAIISESDTDTTLWVSISDTDLCDDDSYGNANPLIMVPAADLNDGDELVVYVGTYAAGTADARVSVGSTLTTASSTAASGTEFINVSQGFRPDPLILAGVSVGGNRSPSLEDCSYGFIPEFPQASIVYDSSSGASNLYFYAESDTDTTLVVVFENREFRCDDDSHGTGDPIVVFPDAGSGQYQVWVGTYNEGQSAAANLHISEKMPQ